MHPPLWSLDVPWQTLCHALMARWPLRGVGNTSRVIEGRTLAWTPHVQLEVGKEETQKVQQREACPDNCMLNMWRCA